jgi:ligand-binding sensor domain-containing protein
MAARKGREAMWDGLQRPINALAWPGRVLAMLLLLAVPLAAVAQMQSPRMQRFLASDGLPSRQVLQLAKDSKGNIWAATADGLARMDGTEIRVWQHQPGQRDSLPLNYIESLAIDDEDRVWVGSNGMGLLRLRADGSGFEVFP